MPKSFLSVFSLHIRLVMLFTFFHCIACSCSGFMKLSLVHENGKSSQTALVEFCVSSIIIIIHVCQHVRRTDGRYGGGISFQDVDCAKAALEKYQGSSFTWISNGGRICIELVKPDLARDVSSLHDCHLTSLWQEGGRGQERYIPWLAY